MSESRPVVEGWPRWGSAADTVCEHPTQAEAREYEANTTTVHRWPSGPWITDDGKVWAGDESLAALQGDLWASRSAVERLERRVDALRRALAASGAPEATQALAEDDEAVREPERLIEAVRGLAGLA